MGMDKNTERWQRTVGGAWVLERNGVTVAKAYSTGSRLATDRWHWTAGGDHGSASILAHAKDNALRALAKVR